MDEERALTALEKKIRAAFVDTALNSYEDAAANGLCAEGAWEVAVDAMRRVELRDLLKELALKPVESSER